MEDTNIENRTIPGITGKLLWSLVAGWTSLIVTILMTYGSIKSEFQTQDNANKIQDVRLNGVENGVNINDLRLRSLEEKVNENKANISVLKAESQKN